MSSGPRQHFHWRSKLHFLFAFHSVINLSAYVAQFNLTLLVNLVFSFVLMYMAIIYI